MYNPNKKYTLSGTIHSEPETREYGGKIHSTFDFLLRDFSGESISNKTTPIPVDVCVFRYKRRSLSILQKGANITMEGCFQPQTTTLSNGVESRQIVFDANEIYLTPES
ncbi:MAG: hypothetical protein Q4B58_05620 [Bacteroidales bacterium]|nr:hypothetical protein [Bacteroidales bacterium]